MKNVFNKDRVAYNTRALIKSNRLQIVKDKEYFVSTLIRADKSRYTLCGVDGCHFLGYAILDSRKAVTEVEDTLDSQVLNTEGVHDVYIMVWGRMSDLGKLMVIDEEVSGDVGYIENTESIKAGSSGTISGSDEKVFYDGGQLESYDFAPDLKTVADYIYDGGDI